MKQIIKCLFIFLGMFFLYNIAGKNSVAIPHEQWYLAKNTKYAINIGVQEMWEIVEMEKIKHIVTVAIIDGGIDMRKNDSNRNIVKDNFSYTIVMLLFQMIVIFVLPFLREISVESKLHFISVTTCGLFGVTVIRLVAIWKENYE